MKMGRNQGRRGLRPYRGGSGHQVSAINHQPATSPAWVAWYLRKRRRSAQRAAVPPAPGNLVAVDNGGAFVTLTWDDVAGAKDGFRIYREVDQDGVGIGGEVGASTFDFEDCGVVSGHRYDYYVVAFNGVGESGPSNVATVLMS